VLQGGQQRPSTEPQSQVLAHDSNVLVSTTALLECMPIAAYCNLHLVLAIVHIIIVNNSQYVVEIRGIKGFVDK
jgi:hypothetical protein